MYTCGNNLLNANPMLFPPADASLPNIVNDTLAAIVHNDSYTTFCGQLPAYLLCVKEAYRNSPKDIDNKLKIYIDVDGLDSAMDLYCHNNDSITNQFQCTKQAVESYRCPYGGIYGMMKYVAMALHTGLPRQQFCTGYLLVILYLVPCISVTPLLTMDTARTVSANSLRCVQTVSANSLRCVHSEQRRVGMFKGHEPPYKSLKCSDKSVTVNLFLTQIFHSTLSVFEIYKT